MSLFLFEGYSNVSRQSKNWKLQIFISYCIIFDQILSFKNLNAGCFSSVSSCLYGVDPNFKFRYFFSSSYMYGQGHMQKCLRVSGSCWLVLETLQKLWGGGGGMWDVKKSTWLELSSSLTCSHWFQWSQQEVIVTGEWIYIDLFCLLSICSTFFR